MANYFFGFYMNKLILVIIHILITIPLFAQTQVLKEYDFNNGGYTLLFVQQQPYKINEKEYTELSNYYIDDISTLNKIKKDWVFEKSKTMYACGYSFVIYLCKNNKLLDTFYINLDCEQISTKYGFYNFKINHFIMIKRKLKKQLLNVINF